MEQTCTLVERVAAGMNVESNEGAVIISKSFPEETPEDTKEVLPEETP